MDQQELQASLVEFERGRNQLGNISAQKQQIQIQQDGLNQAIEELSKTKETKVFKAVGSVLLAKNVADVKKELEDQKESLDLRLKTVTRQESLMVDKLNKLRTQLEGKAAPQPETKISTKSKN